MRNSSLYESLTDPITIYVLIKEMQVFQYFVCKLHERYIMY